jgi:hypothetical protein
MKHEAGKVKKLVGESEAAGKKATDEDTAREPIDKEGQEGDH